MTLTRLTLIVTLMLALSAGLSFAGELKVGDARPTIDQKMKNVNGAELKLSDIKGAHGTLVIFSCNHCPYVLAWQERIASIGNEYSGKGIGVIQINSNDPERKPQDGFEEMVTRAQELKLKFPYVVDATSDVARAFGAEKTPEVFLFDKELKLVYAGAVDDNAEHADQVKKHYLRDALEHLVSGQPLAKSETKAIGCSIKFREPQAKKSCSSCGGCGS